MSGTSNREVKTSQGDLVSAGYTQYTYGRWTNGTNASFCIAHGAYKYGGTWSKETVTTKAPYSKALKSDGTPIISYHAPDYRPDDYHAHDGSGMFDDGTGDCCWWTYTSDGTQNDLSLWYWETSEYIPAVYKTLYSYRDQIPVYTHSKWETGDWTPWGEATSFEEDAAHKRNTETRTVYRYDLDALQQAVNTGISVSGSFSAGKLVATVTAPADAVLLAASHNGSGKQTEIKIIPIQTACANMSQDVGLLMQTGYTYKLMLVKNEGFIPLCEIWSGQ